MTAFQAGSFDSIFFTSTLSGSAPPNDTHTVWLLLAIAALVIGGVVGRRISRPRSPNPPPSEPPSE